MQKFSRILLEKEPYIIADTHIGHSRIIPMCRRPFQDIEQMNETLIDNWNNTITDEDIIIHLGDVILAKGEEIQEYLNRLKGRKCLIRGNHDYSNSVTKWKRLGFDEVWTTSKHPHEFVLVEWQGQEYALSHYYLPLEWGYRNIHGHVHNNVEYLDPRQQVCVSVECIDYKPILLSEALKRFCYDHDENLATSKFSM